jgi:hypothetical protein
VLSEHFVVASRGKERESNEAMKPRSSRSGFASQSLHGVMAVLCVALLSPGVSVALAQQAQQENAAPTEEAPKIPNDQLDSLVAPIALYPDQLLSQTLVASTYPLEIIQLQQWLEKNKNLKGKALSDAVEKQNWDPSIQAMAAIPDVVKQLGDNIAWTSDLGNAFLAQESDVMDAVQRMRAKAEGAGNLKTSQQQKVETQQVEGKSVVVIQQASPAVVYVPSYNPTVVYGEPAYPYPPIYYPPVGAYAAGAALSFGVGVAVGSVWGNGGWGWGCGWGHGDVNVNVNNKYVNNYNKNNYNKANFNKQGGTWQHNPQHRGGAPYSNKQTANKYGGAGNRPGGANRPAGGAGAGNIGANRPGGGGAGAANRPGGGGAGTANRPGGGGAGAANRPGGGGAGAANRPGGGGAGAANRPGGGGAGARPGGSGAGARPSGGSAKNQIGNRSASSRPSSASRGGGFGGGSGNYARASSNRGGHSMGASRGGGGHRGGGGGHRGGGGGRRR